METIWSIINGLKQDVFIVIDALDECPLPERCELLDHINELRNRGNTKVHILATSRREPDIDDKLKEPPTIAVNVEHLVEGDIKIYVQAALLKDEKLSRWNEDSKSLIREKLTAVDETRFRWADLQIKRLQSCREKGELIDALNTVPESPEKTYEEALEKIPAKDEKRVQKILMWLTSSFRPMTLEEIAAVVSFPFAADVLELCTSLLVTLIDGEVNQTIKLAHFSVKEYLILTTLDHKVYSWYRFKNELAQVVISEIAVTCLLDQNDSIRSDEMVIPTSLLEYSAQFWPQHAVEAFESDSNGTLRLQDQINSLFNSDHSLRYVAWLQIHDPDERFTFNRTQKPHYPQPLYYASLLGLRMTVEILLEKGCRITMDEGVWGNALNAAAIHGYFEILKCLGKYHAKIGSIADLPRIAWEIQRNVERIFALFLSEESGAVINHDVVKAAAGNWRSGKEVMMVLLEERVADIVITEEVVKAAAGNEESGKKVMMVLLEKRGADIMITEEVVKAAAGNWRSGNEVVMVLLKDRGADVVITEEVVALIAGKFDEEVMMVLLKKRGADVMITEEVVKAAAGNEESGNKVMMVLLEERGADVIITKEVVKAAAGNKESGNEVMMVLLESHSSHPKI